jgi:hypothetical protein
MKCLYNATSVKISARMALNNDPEKYRRRPGHTGEKCVIVEGLMKEDQRIKIHETHCRYQLCIILHLLERNSTIILKL